jgi:hypothetical protein
MKLAPRQSYFWVVQRSEEIIIATSSGYFRNLKQPTVFMKELIKNQWL